MATPEDVYIRIWEFQAQAGREKEFEKIYGPEGDWVELFRKSKAFLCTEVYRDLETSGRYVTIDYFSSQAAFQSFLKEFRERYDSLDQLGETVCASEKRIGSFGNVQKTNSH
jgi:heme-degrading monooxygenase HmoA